MYGSSRSYPGLPRLPFRAGPRGRCALLYPLMSFDGKRASSARAKCVPFHHSSSRCFSAFPTVTPPSSLTSNFYYGAWKTGFIQLTSSNSSPCSSPRKQLDFSPWRRSETFGSSTTAPNSPSGASSTPHLPPLVRGSLLTMLADAEAGVAPSKLLPCTYASTTPSPGGRRFTSFTST